MATPRYLPPPPSSGPIGPALRHIDRHLHEPLTLGELAAACGLSPFHFARLFTALTGMSPIAYVRHRKLAAAAWRLVGNPGLRLIDLALDSGFESQEAFTRAFVRAFGVPPGRLRRAHMLLQQAGPTRMDAMDIDLEHTLLTEPELMARPALRVAGLCADFDADTKHEIPKLWQKLVPRLPLPGQAGGDAYGICWSSGPEGSFRYMAAVELALDAPVPDGLECQIVPAQTYQVFRQKMAPGPFHPQVAAAMAEIWGRRMAACGHRPSGGPDLEVCPPDLIPGVTEGWQSYWIPVEV